MFRGQDPVFWATWGHTSPYVPEDVITDEVKAAALMKWIARDRSSTAQPSEVQRFCIVVGMVLRDLTLIADADSTSLWPEHVPGYMAVSQIDASERGAVLAACSSAFLDEITASPVTVEAGMQERGKGKGRATVHQERHSGRSKAGDAAVQTGPPLPRELAALSRRTTRSRTRRS